MTYLIRDGKTHLQCEMCEEWNLIPSIEVDRSMRTNRIFVCKKCVEDQHEAALYFGKELKK